MLTSASLRGCAPHAAHCAAYFIAHCLFAYQKLSVGIDLNDGRPGNTLLFGYLAGYRMFGYQGLGTGLDQFALTLGARTANLHANRLLANQGFRPCRHLGRQIALRSLLAVWIGGPGKTWRNSAATGLRSSASIRPLWPRSSGASRRPRKCSPPSACSLRNAESCAGLAA